MLMKIHRNGLSIRKSVLFNLLLFGLVFSPIRLGWAQQIKTGMIEVSGHFDIQAVQGNVSVANNRFQLGQLGLDLKSDLGNRITTTVEVAYASETKNVALNQAFVDWNIARKDPARRDNPLGIVRTGFIVGQFDLPFGIDWRTYRSFDRDLVSLPAALVYTHRGWNDAGIQYYGETNWGNWSIFAVNGFGTSPALRIPVRESLPPLAASTDASNSGLLPTEAFGGRTGIQMSRHVEFGTSYGAGFNSDHDQQSRMYGFDATVNYDALELRGEYISRRVVEATGPSTTLGYYVAGTYSLGRPFAAIRIDAYKLNLDPTRFEGSLGAGYAVNKYAQLRAEYQIVEGRANDMMYLQSVVAF